jgi:D-alanyl-lipoteichoic acid acyltransferase DltB (MBOAT superfamily)
MLFNSLEFAIFLPIIFIIYWFINSNTLRFQNIFLLISSYVFYGWWDYRFLLLIVFSSLIDFLIGIGMSKTDNKSKRKLLLLISICVNIGFLGFFKYYNFFVDSFVDAFMLFGKPFDPFRLSIILPVGISFYTFQTLSYSIDVYRKKLSPTKDIIAFFAFVSFFPQLVAGPIERASNLLPQFYIKRVFNYNKAVDGMRQILWGLFKKMIIADNCAVLVNDVFLNYSDYSGSTLLLGGVFFAFQIYCDFSGYSDIAIGTSQLLGFNLMKNFSYPYFSRDIAEFWRRWHISLSTWFRDYLYIPLGGSRGGNWVKIRNIFIIFLVSGFWHGANWTFIAWGFLNALYFMPLMLLGKNRINTGNIAEGKLFPGIKNIVQIGITFFITVIAWVFFRSRSISQALDYIQLMFSKSIFAVPHISSHKTFFIAISFIIVLVLVEWIQRNKEHGLEITPEKLPFLVRWSLYFILVILIIHAGGEQEEFIYFQF